MLKSRILTAFVLITVFIPALLSFSAQAWAIAMLLLSLLALYEWGALIKLKQAELVAYIAVAAILGALVLLLSKTYGVYQFSSKSLIVFIFSAIFWILVAPIWLSKRFVITNKWLMTLLGLLLIAPLWLALIFARDSDPRFLLMMLSTIWIADSAAYFAGKNFGKHKLAPDISPGKTWEGVFGALVGVTLFGLVLRFSFNIRELELFPLLWLMAILGVIGDLFESLMKRQANLKDSGNLLPGHGGILDRIDGLISSLPVGIFIIYAYRAFVTGEP